MKLNIYTRGDYTQARVDVEPPMEGHHPKHYSRSLTLHTEEGVVVLRLDNLALEKIGRAIAERPGER